ncbi:GntR family transcriptional regulator [Mesorhizobium sp. YC-39]|uniref:GntR family transcriptional regulator n=1 Tax=unclassified Mesorhizobium TaxID=325217 RepID=UPI0021E93069|nr:MULTISPECIES: GntR family transcriptional regulator [unclassified Mesorhizobium]MCV3210865.1 GntR family transcriptional regulator [Mesorhizobium sp. YC-2]MCV3231099.1 GntR family transcriptional regulator [Mesorhizobium sp. YC-39]
MQTFSFETLERENLGETVYSRIAEALIKGRFAPDARLTIRDLAQSLGTSVTPVRDAILRLIQDEALVQKSAREVRVPIITLARYREIRQIRLKLEGLAAREAALKAAAKDVEHLRGLIALNERAIADKNWTEALALNQTFHFALADIADMVVLRGILNRLWLQMGPLIAESYHEGGRAMIENHYAVLAAVEKQDADAAERAIVADITEGGRVILERLISRNTAKAGAA